MTIIESLQVYDYAAALQNKQEYVKRERQQVVTHNSQQLFNKRDKIISSK